MQLLIGGRWWRGTGLVGCWRPHLGRGCRHGHGLLAPQFPCEDLRPLIRRHDPRQAPEVCSHRLQTLGAQGLQLRRALGGRLGSAATPVVAGDHELLEGGKITVCLEHPRHDGRFHGPGSSLVQQGRFELRLRHVHARESSFEHLLVQADIGAVYLKVLVGALLVRGEHLAVVVDEVQEGGAKHGVSGKAFKHYLHHIPWFEVASVWFGPLVADVRWTRYLGLG
mmetsp:Transcript_24807/g.77200  ORF Transcript_24807/g.77200 Transcript_24807/m.77200 type:complete len:224 (+) Transcript_24807:319-990(+)